MPSEENALNLARLLARSARRPGTQLHPGTPPRVPRPPALVRRKNPHHRQRARPRLGSNFPAPPAATDSEKDRGVILSSGGAAAAEVEEPVLSLPKEPAGRVPPSSSSRSLTPKASPTSTSSPGLTTGTAADPSAPTHPPPSSARSPPPAAPRSSTTAVPAKTSAGLLSLIEAENPTRCHHFASQDRPVIISPSQDKLVILSEGGGSRRSRRTCGCLRLRPIREEPFSHSADHPTLTGHASAAFRHRPGQRARSPPAPARPSSPTPPSSLAANCF